MTPATLLSDLTARGVEFHANGDKLRFRPVDLLTADEVDAIRQYKSVILKLLQSQVRIAAPIIEGAEHFSPYVDDPDGDWPEFIPGYHYDIRQPSRLRALLSPKPTLGADTRKRIAQNALGIALTGPADS